MFAGLPHCLVSVENAVAWPVMPLPRLSAAQVLLIGFANTFANNTSDFNTRAPNKVDHCTSKVELISCVTPTSMYLDNFSFSVMSAVRACKKSQAELTGRPSARL